MIVVSDTTPLNILAQLGPTDLLEKLFTPFFLRELDGELLTTVGANVNVLHGWSSQEARSLV